MRTPGDGHWSEGEGELKARCQMPAVSALWSLVSVSRSEVQALCPECGGGWAVCSLALCRGVTRTAAGLRLTAPAAHWPVLCTALTVHSTLSPQTSADTTARTTVSPWSQSQTRPNTETWTLSFNNLEYICKLCSSVHLLTPRP